MELNVRHFTTLQGEECTAYEVTTSHMYGAETAGYITKKADGWECDRLGGRRYTYKTIYRAVDAMRAHITTKYGPLPEASK